MDKNKSEIQKYLNNYHYTHLNIMTLTNTKLI